MLTHRIHKFVDYVIEKVEIFCGFEGRDRFGISLEWQSPTAGD
jgi:hypothetical protein